MEIKMLIQKGKHGDCAYDISTQELKHGAALDILKENLDSNFYHEKSLVKKIVKILNKRDGREAWDFITARSSRGYEYESLETDKLLKRKP